MSPSPASRYTCVHVTTGKEGKSFPRFDFSTCISMTGSTAMVRVPSSASPKSKQLMSCGVFQIRFIRKSRVRSPTKASPGCSRPSFRQNPCRRPEQLNFILAPPLSLVPKVQPPTLHHTKPKYFSSYHRQEADVTFYHPTRSQLIE